MLVTITITAGIYEGRSYTGPLTDAPITILVPEGIVSDRTTREAERMRSAIEHALQKQAAVSISSTAWTVLARRDSSD